MQSFVFAIGILYTYERPYGQQFKNHIVLELMVFFSL